MNGSREGSAAREAWHYPGRTAPRRREMSVDDLVDGIVAGDRAVLSRAITLVESRLPSHGEIARDVLRRLLGRTGKSLRVGITGIPGAGKSTMIEALGTRLCDQGRRVAVLAVDPSSVITHGSILGDKTRMERLSREPRAFVRPSPTGGTLGGLTRKSRETMLLCEAAGYDVILIETVGVGQSETAVRGMVDFFLLVAIAGAGDELQGIKKGVIELADAIVVNKADSGSELRAEAARSEYERVLHYIRAATDGWTTGAYTSSAAEDRGIAEIWSVIQRFTDETKASGVFAERRRRQALSWVREMVEDRLLSDYYSCPAVSGAMGGIEGDVLEGRISASDAAEALLALYERGRS